MEAIKYIHSKGIAHLDVKPGKWINVRKHYVEKQRRSFKSQAHRLWYFNEIWL